MPLKEQKTPPWQGCSVVCVGGGATTEKALSPVPTKGASLIDGPPF